MINEKSPENNEVKAWMYPVLLSFKGIKRTDLVESMQQKLEGTVAWGVDLIGDSESVTDKFGVVHEPYPLVRQDTENVSKPAPSPVAVVQKLYFDERNWQSIQPLGDSLDSLSNGMLLYAEPLTHPDTAVDAFLKNVPRLHAELLHRGYPRNLALHLAGATDYDSIKAELERLQKDMEKP